MDQQKYDERLHEFNNYRRRTESELLALHTTATSAFMVKLLPILDALEKAQKALDEAVQNKTSCDDVREGVAIIEKMFRTVLAEYAL